MKYIYSEDYLAHHGVKGMKWGIRKYQNSDGSLTSAGMKRYGVISIDGKMSERGKSRYKLDLAKERLNKFYDEPVNKMTDKEYAINTTNYRMRNAEYKSKGNKAKEFRIHRNQMATEGYINLKNKDNPERQSYSVDLINNYYNELKKNKRKRICG